MWEIQMIEEIEEHHVFKPSRKFEIRPQNENDSTTGSADDLIKSILHNIS